ncbi:hypothetical protein ACGFNU_10885 [Spirillospora sp. NPDC048911]|uniref:hypothetical protein n=1 Tax=Spirillospora sp. NPDC048911 TaxID=3364527 RepID=UPI003724C4D4
MTDPHEEHGEILRRALNAEADTVTPSAEGLELIRTRIEERRGRWWAPLQGPATPRRFGWAWFTESWARPVLAVGAAVAIAGIGVSAPQTVSLFTSPAGHNGPSAGEKDAPKGTVASTQGQPNGSPTQGSPPPAQNGTPASSQRATPPSSSSTATCGPSGGGSPPQSATTPSPGATVPSKPVLPACPTPTPPTTPPPTPDPTDKPTDKPTEEPEPSVTPTPTSSDQQQSTTNESTGAQP